jgi:hypothetical protein
VEFAEDAGVQLQGREGDARLLGEVDEEAREGAVVRCYSAEYQELVIV